MNKFNKLKTKSPIDKNQSFPFLLKKVNNIIIIILDKKKNISASEVYFAVGLLLFEN